MPGIWAAGTAGGFRVIAAHSHSAAGGHGHTPPAAGHRRPLAIVLGITSTVLAVEVVGTLLSGSLALLAPRSPLTRENPWLPRLR